MRVVLSIASLFAGISLSASLLEKDFGSARRGEAARRGRRFHELNPVDAVSSPSRCSSSSRWWSYRCVLKEPVRDDAYSRKHTAIFVFFSRLREMNRQLRDTRHALLLRSCGNSLAKRASLDRPEDIPLHQLLVTRF